MSKDSSSGGKIVLIVVGIGCGLMVLVAILGIVAAIAIPAFLKYKHKQNVTEVHANMQTLRTAGMVAYEDLGHLPKQCDEFIWTHESVPRGVEGSADANFDEGVWAQLQFRLDESTHYRYGYKTLCEQGQATAFIIVGEGDLDGDGMTSHFEQTCRLRNKEVVCEGLYTERELE